MSNIIRKKIRGFTMVELMIVMTIISVLIALILAGIHQAQNEAVELETSNNLKQCAIAIIAYAKHHEGRCPDSWNDLTGGSKSYFDNAEVTKNSGGDQFELTCAGDNMYEMSFNDVLVSDVNGTNPSNKAVFAGGHVDEMP